MLYEQKRQTLQALVELYNRGYIELFFADEVTFALTPSIPYGWLPKGKQTELVTRKTTVMKLFGLVNFENRFYGFPSQNKIDAEFIIEALEQIIRKIEKPTVIILDNARFHHRAVRLKKEEWEKQNLFIFFLPPYSPHLNRIEILWRFLKHRWLKPEHYLNTKTLWNAVINILQLFGTEFKIDFSKQF